MMKKRIMFIKTLIAVTDYSEYINVYDRDMVAEEIVAVENSVKVADDVECGIYRATLTEYNDGSWGVGELKMVLSVEESSPVAIEAEQDRLNEECL